MDNKQTHTETQRDESLVLSKDVYAVQQAQNFRQSRSNTGSGHTWPKGLRIIGYILGGTYIVLSTIAKGVLMAAYIILKVVYGFVALCFGEIIAIFVVALLIGLVIGAITGDPFYKLW